MLQGLLHQLALQLILETSMYFAFYLAPRWCLFSAFAWLCQFSACADLVFVNIYLLR